MNCNSVIVVAEKTVLGQDVMIGRNAIIYDSDFHRLNNKDGKVMNPSIPVIIGDHVWIGTNVMILKGTEIGSNSVIGANTLVKTKVNDGVIFNAKYEPYERGGFGIWDRKIP